MNPLRLRAVNYRSFPDLDLQLPDGTLAILGANGAGKSSIVNLIDTAIFGPQSRSLADVLSDTAPDDDLLVALELEHAGAVYQIRRTYSPRGRGKTTLDLERRLNDEHSSDSVLDWEPLTRASAKDTQELIEETLGLSRETFRASAFLAQGDSAAFTEAQPRDRKRILAEVLDLDRYDRLLKRVRADRHTLDTELQQLAGRAAQVLEQAAQLPGLEREQETLLETELAVADDLADLERAHATLQAEYQAAREQHARRAAAEAELREARVALDHLDALARQAAKAVQEISVATDGLANLPAYPPLAALEQRETDLAAAVAEHERAQAEHVNAALHARTAETRRDDLVRRAREFATKASTLRADAQQLADKDDDTQDCDRCGQPLGQEARARAIQSYHTEADQHTKEATRLGVEADQVEIPDVPAPPAADEPPLNELALVRSQLRACREQQAMVATLRERIVGCENVLDGQPTDQQVAAARLALAAKRDALDGLGAPADLDRLAAEGRRAADEVATARARLEQHKLLRARIQERLTVARAAAEQAAEIEKTSKALRAEVDVVATLERAFSPNGIPALIVENAAIPYLETEATRILAALGTSYRVELRTQAALKSGDGVRDTLDVIVCTDQGDRPYETFSGGERTRINLALRIALARLLAHRRGAESRLLCIDEVEYLDEPGQAALVEVLQDLAGDFDKVWLVSHVPALRDSFEQVLTVVRDEAGSRVEGGYPVDIQPVEALA